MPWFRKKKGKIEPVSDKDRVVRTENVFVRCEECGAHLYKKELEEAQQVCVHCNYHFRIGAYYLDGNSRTKRANIFCPYAIGFNAKEIPQKIFMRTAASSPRWLKSKA